MSLQKPSIVIFDMDGTSVRHINIYLLHVLEKIDDMSYTVGRFIDWIFRKKAQGPIISRDDFFLNRKKPRLLVHRALHHLRRKEVDQIVEPCPGIYSVLSFLKKNKVPLALASNGLGKGYGHDVLEKFGLNGFFQVTIFREDITKSKPNPQGLLLALSRLNVEITDKDIVWYIGDRHKDVIAALSANGQTPAKIIPIAYGINAALAILKKGQTPEQIIMSYPEMHLKLIELWGDHGVKAAGS